MIRNILGIIAGYALFVISSLALFKISGRAPHAEPTNGFMMLTAAYGVVFSFLAGLLTKSITHTKKLWANYILCLVIAGFAAFSFFKATGTHWTQLMAIFIFAPVSVSGGWFYQKRHGKQ